MEMACRRSERMEKSRQDRREDAFSFGGTNEHCESDTENLLRQLKDDDTCPMSLLHSHGREKCARDYAGSAGASRRVACSQHATGLKP